jgi:protein transport protein SEC13
LAGERAGVRVAAGRRRAWRLTRDGFGPAQVAWSHPKYDSLLASCGFDRKVIIYREKAAGSGAFEVIFQDSFDASVNSVAWMPSSFSLQLAAASADGTVKVYVFDEASRQFLTERFTAHHGGVNAVSWAPEIPRGALLGAAQQAVDGQPQLVTGGCDNCVMLWARRDSKWVALEQKGFEQGDNRHRDWVRDVAWAPNVGLPRNTIASCSEDKTVIVWTQDGASGVWKKAATLPFESKVWRVSWSLMGNLLAVAQGDNKVSLWKEGPDGKWLQVSAVADADEAKAEQQPQPQPH